MATLPLSYRLLSFVLTAGLAWLGHRLLAGMGWGIVGFILGGVVALHAMELLRGRLAAAREDDRPPPS